MRHFSDFFLEFLANLRPPGIITPQPHNFYATEIFTPLDNFSAACCPLTLPYNFSPKCYSVSEIGGGGGKTRSPTGIRTCADGMPDAITFFVVELCEMIVVKY